MSSGSRYVPISLYVKLVPLLPTSSIVYRQHVASDPRLCIFTFFITFEMLNLLVVHLFYKAHTVQSLVGKLFKNNQTGVCLSSSDVILRHLLVFGS